MLACSTEWSSKTCSTQKHNLRIDWKFGNELILPTSTKPCHKISILGSQNGPVTGKHEFLVTRSDIVKSCLVQVAPNIVHKTHLLDISSKPSQKSFIGWSWMRAPVRQLTKSFLMLPNFSPNHSGFQISCLRVLWMLLTRTGCEKEIQRGVC